jgi:hypothetical protein
VLLAASAPAEAAKRIKGKLSAPGYTVIALAEDGSAASAQANPGFKLTPPAKNVTLHLRALDGQYAGPVVVGRKGKNAIVGLKAGAKLGKVKVRDGYAKVSKKLPKESLDKQAKAVAENKVPIGAGNFGRVASAASVPGPDQDLDGIPTPLDIDDDGDLILDDVDRVTAGAASPAQVSGNPPAIFVSAFTSLPLRAATTIVNANAPGLDDEVIQSSLRAHGQLHINTSSYASAELDCAGDPSATPPRPGLSYCWANGTGTRILGGEPPSGDPFPACCDADGDGHGALQHGPWPGLGGLLLHGAGADEIRGGDPFLVRATNAGGEELELTGSLATVFATPPAIAYYVDELGTRHDISYPHASGTVHPVVDGPDAGSDVSITLTFWRPQRRPVPDELPPGAGNWIDIGGLLHYARVFGAAPDGPCPESSYSAVEPGLVPSPGFPASGLPHFLLIDDAFTDKAADPGNTFSYTLNLSQCRAFYGHSFEPGDPGPSPFGFVAQLPAESGSPTFADSSYLFRNQP